MSRQTHTNRKIKHKAKVVQTLPSVKLLERLVGTAMCDQDNGWQESRHFTERKTSEFHDVSAGGPPKRFRLPGEWPG